MSRTKKSTPGNNKKRKATDDAEQPNKREKEAKKPSTKDASLDTEASIDLAYSHMSPDILGDHLAAQTRKLSDDLSLLELEERRIPVAAIRDTTDFEPQRTLEQMPAFMRQYSSPRRDAADLSKSAKANGTPHTIVVAGAGLRAANVTRALREFQTKDATVMKLFAKHIKLEEAKESVKKTRMGIGVGTPKRISDLLDDGALSAAKLERIVVDVSHIDQKKRGILDMKDLQPALMALLNRPDLKERYGAEKDGVELLFY